MNTIVALLVEEILNEPTERPGDKSQLSLTLGKIEERVRLNKFQMSATQKYLIKKLSGGRMLAARTFVTDKSLDNIAKHLCDKFNGSMDCSVFYEGENYDAKLSYGTIEFPSKSETGLINWFYDNPADVGETVR